MTVEFKCSKCGRTFSTVGTIPSEGNMCSYCTNSVYIPLNHNMERAYLILFINKDTGMVSRAQTANSFPVAQLGIEGAQVCHLIEFARDFDTALRQLYKTLRKPGNRWLHRFLYADEYTEMLKA